MRLLLAAGLVAALAVTGAAAGEEAKEKGTVEKAGAYIDQGLESARDLFSDSAITTRIKKRLVDDPVVPGLNVKITTRNQIVIVEGEVDSEDIARRTMDIVRATEGVKDAENHLRIVIKKPSRVR